MVFCREELLRETSGNGWDLVNSGCLPFTWGNRLVDGLCKWKAKFLLEISVWGRRVPFEQQTQLAKRA